MPCILYHVLFGALYVRASWQTNEDWKNSRDGRDLQQFVTRPELKAPRYMVRKHHPAAITPGYWFVSPYTHIGVSPSAKQRDFAPCMNGAHIYDGEGELVWSGACAYDNRNVFNFRPLKINGSDRLTFFLSQEIRNSEASLQERLPSGVLMDNRFEEVSRTYAKGPLLDAHEFVVDPHRQSAIFTTIDTVEATVPAVGQSTRRVLSTGFQEVNVGTGKLDFEWDPVSSGIPLNESCDIVGMASTDHYTAWDFFHINSVDRFANGDYLISSRHMSTVYRIARHDGRAIWKLGGCWDNSDFKMDDNLPFSWQHHATIQAENETHTVISLFDNGSEELGRGIATGRHPPAGKIVLLDMEAMTAKMLRRFDRPDGGQTALLGSIQVLGDDIHDSNVLVNWAIEGYISEYDASDTLLVEASFMSDRQRTYRAYKAQFIGDPQYPPVLKVLSIGVRYNEAASAFYVSWNGATAVAWWAIYSGDSKDDKSFQHLATIKKRGFETTWVTLTLQRYAYAEALDKNGRVLGRSDVASIDKGPLSDDRVPTSALEGTRPASKQLMANFSEDHSTEPDRLPSPKFDIPVIEAESLTGRYVAVSMGLSLRILAALGLYSLLRKLVTRFTKRSRSYAF